MVAEHDNIEGDFSFRVLPAIGTPIKHIDRKNQRIFGIGLANHLILLMPKFEIACYARKAWCGKYLLQFN